MTTMPIAVLTAAFEESVAAAGMDAELDAKHNGRAVIISWPSVPIEIVRAAGLVPIIARGGLAATPTADAYLESEIFPSRLRMLAEAALTGRLSTAARIIIPRTSEPDYKFFLYLKEFVRLGTAPALPPVLLFDLLQSQGTDVLSYNAARSWELLSELTRVSNRLVTLDDVRHEIVRTNAARAASRRLMSLRRGVPRVTGTEVFPLLCAFWSVDPQVYAALAGAAADEIAKRPPLGGPRVLLTGAPVDGTALHSAIEACGAVVVSEIGPWGSGEAGADVADVDADEDPITALAEKYGSDAIGPRTPAAQVRARIVDLLDNVDAVVVSLPPEDTAFGWDYPALRSLLQQKGIPHTCLYSDSCGPVSAADEDRLNALMTALPVRTEVRRG
jgi:benzoyl-CoA reductase/2-hydroxyglutaryl-CoA dehydratase subunit BcrC/BadD/HgdB